MNVKLYGISITVVPKKDNQRYGYSVICSPISSSSATPKKFELLNDLKFTQHFDLRDKKQMQECFSALVSTLEKVVKLQKESCDDAWVDYQPVSLIIGQDSRHPVNLNAIYMQLFGEEFSKEKTILDEIKVEALQHSQLIKNAIRLYFLRGEKPVAIIVDGLLDLVATDPNKKAELCKSLNQSPLFFRSGISLGEFDLENKEKLKAIFTNAFRQYKNPVDSNALAIDAVDKTCRNILNSKIEKLNQTDFKNLNNDDREGVERIAQVMAYDAFRDKTSLDEYLQEYKKIPTILIYAFPDMEYKFQQAERVYGQGKYANLNPSHQESHYTDSTFQEACGKLSSLIQKCVVKEGNFQYRPIEGDIKEILHNKQIENISSFIKEPSAYYESLQQAQEDGAAFGEYQYQKNPSIFAYPTVSCDETPEIRKSFDDAFQKAYLGPHSRWVKLGLDVSSPPFVDPLLWMLADQHRIVQGKRWHMATEDNPQWRQKIENSASRVHGHKID